MQQEAADPYVNAVMDAIRRVVRALRQSSRHAEQALGLSGAQLFVLQKLAATEAPIALGELAARTMTHPSSVSVVVARLVDRGFVARAASQLDGRRIEVRLTSKGRAFLNKASHMTAQEQLSRALARLPVKQRAQMAELWTSVVEDAGFADETASMFFEDAEDARK